MPLLVFFLEFVIPSDSRSYEAEERLLLSEFRGRELLFADSLTPDS